MSEEENNIDHIKLVTDQLKRAFNQDLISISIIMINKGDLIDTHINPNNNPRVRKLMKQAESLRLDQLKSINSNK